MIRTRIYRTSTGWTAIRRDPSGGAIRDTYPTGQAALEALDARNRPRKPGPALTTDNPVAALGEAFVAMFAMPIYAIQDAIKPGTGKVVFQQAFPHLTRSTR